MKKYKKVLSLKPTQFAVGILEIQEKIEVMKKLSPRQLREFVKQTPIPVVIAPTGEMYFIDHHHFLFACWQVGVKRVKIKIVKDLSGKKMTLTQFWSFMSKSNYFYPFCQFGEGPRNSLYLPQDIRGLADDPYRSLAWFVRHDGGYGNSNQTFSEFKWANFFRSKKLLHRYGRDGFEQAVEKALSLSKSSEAKNLPGFTGK